MHIERESTYKSQETLAKILFLLVFLIFQYDHWLYAFFEVLKCNSKENSVNACSSKYRAPENVIFMPATK